MLIYDLDDPSIRPVVATALVHLTILKLVGVVGCHSILCLWVMVATVFRDI